MCFTLTLNIYRNATTTAAAVIIVINNDKNSSTSKGIQTKDNESISINNLNNK
jgi:hypothetical protein